MSPNSRRIVSVVLIALSCVGGCASRGKTVFFLVDRSTSVQSDQHSARCLDAWRKVIDTAVLQPGDRIVLGSIDAATYDNFKPDLDVSIPGYNPIWDNPDDVKLPQRIARQRLDSALVAMLRSTTSTGTALISGFRLAEKVLADDWRRRRLIVCSDMLESSALAEFEGHELSDTWIDAHIATLRNKRLLPDLAADTVQVVGAVARPDVQRYWQRFVAAAGGVLLASDYGPALMSARP